MKQILVSVYVLFTKLNPNLRISIGFTKNNTVAREIRIDTVLMSDSEYSTKNGRKLWIKRWIGG